MIDLIKDIARIYTDNPYESISAKSWNMALWASISINPDIPINSVNAFLISSEISTHFSLIEYTSTEKYAIHNKLSTVLNLIPEKIENIYDIVYVSTCYMFVDKGYSLTEEIISYLNEIYIKYERYHTR